MKHIKISRHILLLCALTLAATPALGARAYDDNVVVGTTEAVALEDVALEKESSTDEPVLKPRQSRSLAKVLGMGAVLGVGALQSLIFRSVYQAKRKETMFAVIKNYAQRHATCAAEDTLGYYLAHALCAAGGAGIASLAWLIGLL